MLKRQNLKKTLVINEILHINYSLHINEPLDTKDILDTKEALPNKSIKVEIDAPPVDTHGSTANELIIGSESVLHSDAVTIDEFYWNINDFI